jgi:hypothetical protein
MSGIHNMQQKTLANLVSSFQHGQGLRGCPDLARSSKNMSLGLEALDPAISKIFCTV